MGIGGIQVADFFRTSDFGDIFLPMLEIGDAEKEEAQFMIGYWSAVLVSLGNKLEESLSASRALPFPVTCSSSFERNLVPGDHSVFPR